MDALDDDQLRLGRLGPASELLRTFLAVAEHGNVTRAANRLARTQSGVSIQLRKLEQELGVQLFDRLPRGMSLTTDGLTLVPVARRIVREIDAVPDLFTDPLTGQINIGLPEEYSGLVFADVLRAFGDRHRDVEVRAICGCSQAFPDLIASGELDVALYAAPPREATDAFVAEPMVWASQELFQLDDDEPLPLAVLDRTCWWGALPAETLASAGRTWRTAYSSASYEGLKTAIEAGLAVGMLPQSALQPGMIARTDLPPLPLVSLVLLRDRARAQPLLDAMEQAIHAAFENIR